MLAVVVPVWAYAFGATVTERPGQKPEIAEAVRPGGPADDGRAEKLNARLAKAGLARGAPVLMRIFKEESRLELWMLKGERFEKFSTYPICRWKGILGPKIVEGDKQSPEGFYSFSQESLVWQGRWFRGVNLNFPNTLDRAHNRTGSGILIHGGCSSIGCFAMTDSIIDEVFDITVAAFAAGQSRVQVHVFPFQMTKANLTRHAKNPWAGFWNDLKPASDLFVATQVPPRIGVCDGRYVMEKGEPGAPIDKLRDWCGAVGWPGSPDRMASVLASRRENAAPPDVAPQSKAPSERVKLYAKLTGEGLVPKPKPMAEKPVSFGPSPVAAATDESSPLADLPTSERNALLGVRVPKPITPAGTPGTARAPLTAAAQAALNAVAARARSAEGAAAVLPVARTYKCNPNLPACRLFMANNPPPAFEAVAKPKKSKVKVARQ